MRVAAFLVLLVAGIHSAAATEAAAPVTGKPAIAAVLKDFGLFGAWAVNCALPATPANPHVSIVETEPGTVVERHDLGPEYETNSYSVIAAAPVSTTRVSLDVVFKPAAEGEQRQHLILRVDHDTRRTMYNRVEHGAVVVKDGVVVGHGAHTPLLHKCG
jgi:hypothetical protein